MTAQQSCIFCRIVKGEIPAHLVDQDDATMAFLDINPAAPGHTMIIPKKHVADIYGLDDDTAAAVMRATVRVAKAVRKTLAPAGLTVLERNGEVAGQGIMHLHVHVIPRTSGDGVGLSMNQAHAAQSELQAMAAKLRSAAR